MSPIQLSAVLVTFLAPLLLWIVSRSWRAPRFDFLARRLLAVMLLVLWVGLLVTKFAAGEATWDQALPMQLCDWVLLAVAAALWWRSQAAFELGYFWGLAGTVQALFTPAIEADLAWWRQCGFFYAHALIVVGVLHLLLTERLRPWPRSLVRVLIWSEAFLLLALLTNWFTGGNYAFLARKPPQASMLDLFSDTPWLYVLQINFTGLTFFAALYLPWLALDRWRARHPGSVPIRHA
ncbi:MAG TPA: TIGR02206 family membrane protein [Chthoniobacteraceae bacterium]|jgi:hypothetical integral membrane protein (TIGR02206 family)